MANKKKEPQTLFVVELPSGEKLKFTTAAVNKFIVTDKRKFLVRNAANEVVFKKVFKG